MARIEKTIEVDVPVRTAYNQWTQFEEFPQFMEGVHEVRQVDNTHLHWRAEVAGREKEWDAVIREQVPDQRIIWAATDGAENAGVVRFDTIGTAKTRVHLEMSYDPEGFVESAGNALGFVSRRVEGDLQRFKDFIESRGAETGGYRREHHNPDVPGGHTRGEAAQPMTAAPAKGAMGTRKASDEAYRGAGMEFSREDYPGDTRAHSASGQPRGAAPGGLSTPSEISATDVFNRPSGENTYGSQATGTGPASTFGGTTVDRTTEGRAGFENTTPRRETATFSGGTGEPMSGDEGDLPFGEETPDVAGEFTGSSVPMGGMADPDREGRVRVETPGAQPGSVSRETRQQATVEPGPAGGGVRLETPGAMQPGSLSREAHQRAGMGPGPTADASTSGMGDLESGEGEDALFTSGERTGPNWPSPGRGQ